MDTESRIHKHLRHAGETIEANLFDSQQLISFHFRMAEINAMLFIAEGMNQLAKTASNIAVELGKARSGIPEQTSEPNNSNDQTQY